MWFGLFWLNKDTQAIDCKNGLIGLKSKLLHFSAPETSKLLRDELRNQKSVQFFSLVR